MSGLRLNLASAPAFDLDCSNLLPEHLLGQSLDEVKRLRLAQGKRQVALGDLFEVSADDSEKLSFANVSPVLRRLGHGMRGGEIHILGNAGDEVGVGMRSGRIVVKGSAGDFIGSGMRGGHIQISGNCGDFVGGSLPHESLGMRDGIISVGGNVGARAGHRMRRGLLIVNGAAGDYCASNMVAGSIVLLAAVGQGLGTGMRRGTILLRELPQELAATFNDCGEYSLAFLALMLNAVRVADSKAYRKLKNTTQVRRLVGDHGAGGQGEILIANLATTGT